MNLQPSVQTHETVQLSGGSVEVRGLTQSEASHVAKIKDPDESNVVAFTYAIGDPEDHVRAWYAQASAADAMALMRAINRATGIDEGATFPVATGNDVGTPRQG